MLAKYLRRNFHNPPKGGNEVGVPTAASMSPLPPVMGSGPTDKGAQKPLHQTMQDGINAARIQAVQSGRVNQPEFRNYDRGNIPYETNVDPTRLQWYDYESSMVPPGGRISEGMKADPKPGGIPKPTLRPDTSMPARSDGKPYFIMGKPSGNSPTFRSDRDNDGDDIDLNGGDAFRPGAPDPDNDRSKRGA